MRDRVVREKVKRFIGKAWWATLSNVGFYSLENRESLKIAKQKKRIRHMFQILNLGYMYREWDFKDLKLSIEIRRLLK